MDHQYPFSKTWLCFLYYDAASWTTTEFVNSRLPTTLNNLAIIFDI